MGASQTSGLLTVAEVCARTRLSKTTVHREIYAGEFEVLRLGPKGGSIRITSESVDAYEDRRRTIPAA